MRKKNVTTEMMKDYIAESLLLLMETKPYPDIRISEIAEKAGVNRSTYYRNFSCKEDIIKHFFIGIMENHLKTVPADVDMQGYLTGMFHAFLAHKGQIMLICHNNTAYILFDTLNSYFAGRAAGKATPGSFQERFALYYHTGGIFNTLLLWFANDMQPTPEELANISTSVLPPHFKPALL